MTEAVEVLKKKAHDLVQKGKLDSALRAFTLILESDPEDASVHNKVGDILLKTNSEKEALDHFLTSAELYYQEGLHMVALSVCRKVLRASANIPMAHYIMGKCYQSQDKPDQAKREYAKYLSIEGKKDGGRVSEVLRALTTLDPGEDKWVLLLAKTAYKQKNEAFLDYAVGLAMERDMPQHARMHEMLTTLRKNQIRKSLDSAVAAMPERVRRKPVKERGEEPVPKQATRKPSPKPTVEESILETLDFSEADFGTREQVEQEQRVVDEIIGVNHDPDRETPFSGTLSPGPRRIGEYFVASGLLKAGDVLRALDRQTADMKDARLGDVLVSMGLVSVRQVREALSRQVADIRANLANNPTDALGHVEMANLLLDVGDFYGAVSAYLQAAEIYRNEDRDYMVFELLEGVLDICPESLSAAKELIRIRHTIGSSGQARAFYRLAVAYLLNGSNYESMAALQAALEVDPSYTDARNLMVGICPDYKDHRNLADMAEILDDIENVKTDSSKGFLAGMIREFKEGVSAYVTAEDYKTHFDLGIAYMEMGLLREAVSEFEKVLASPEFRLRAREMLGRCSFSMQRYDEAEDHFRKGMALSAGDMQSIVGFHVNLAKVYTFTGRDSHAAAELEAASTLDPVLSKILSLE